MKLEQIVNLHNVQVSSNGILTIRGTLTSGCGFNGYWAYKRITTTIKITIRNGIVTSKSISGTLASSSTTVPGTEEHHGSATFEINSVVWEPA